MNSEMNRRSEEILNSLDGVRRATAPDFFYSRLRARMEREILPSGKSGWALRPVYALIALFVVLLINAAIVFKSSTNNENNIAATDTDSLQLLATEYRVSEAGSMYDLSQDR